jgi:hypothetical protein
MFKVDQKKNFPCTLQGQQSFEGQKTTFKSRYGMSLSIIFLFLSEFSARGYAKIHIQRPFFDNKKDIYKILRLKIQMAKICSSASSTRIRISISNGISKFRLWANFGSFGQNLLH